jgi:transcriptional regulator with XRE-family HTH domain
MNDDDSGTIGARLRELRRWRRMTLTEVAGLAGISAAYLSMAERGLRSLDRRSTISALASKMSWRARPLAALEPERAALGPGYLV